MEINLVQEEAKKRNQTSSALLQISLIFLVQIGYEAYNWSVQKQIAGLKHTN